MNLLIISLFIIIALETFAIYRLNKLCEDWEKDYDILKDGYDLIAQSNRQLRKELELEKQTNKVEAKLMSKEKVSKPRGRKPKNKKEEN